MMERDVVSHRIPRSPRVQHRQVLPFDHLRRSRGHIHTYSERAIVPYVESIGDFGAFTLFARLLRLGVVPGPKNSHIDM